MVLKYFAFKHALKLLVLYLDWFVPWRITLTHPAIHLNEKRGGKRICQNDVCMHWVPVGKQEPPHAVFSFWPLSSSSSGELPVPLCPCPVPCFPFRHTSLSLSLSLICFLQSSDHSTGQLFTRKSIAELEDQRLWNSHIWWWGRVDVIKIGA
jgi:hypothetical protein